MNNDKAKVFCCKLRFGSLILSSPIVHWLLDLSSEPMKLQIYAFKVQKRLDFKDLSKACSEFVFFNL